MTEVACNSKSNLLREIRSGSVQASFQDSQVVVVPRSTSIQDDGSVCMRQLRNVCRDPCALPLGWFSKSGTCIGGKSLLGCWEGVGKDTGSEIQVQSNKLEDLMSQLFRLQDLNGNNLLEEEELIKLNEKITMLHKGRDADRGEVRDRYRSIFRTQLNANGEPASYETFRVYMANVLEQLDPGDMFAQEMILDQYINEAKVGRSVFHIPSFTSSSDVPWLPRIASDERKSDDVNPLPE